MVCGLPLIKYSDSMFNASTHWAFDEGMSVKLNSTHTADLGPPRFGRMGDNIVCNVRCAHKLLVTAVRAVGFEDFARLMPAVAAPRKRTSERYRPDAKRQAASRREFVALIEKALKAGLHVQVCRITAPSMRTYCSGCCTHATGFGILETTTWRHPTFQTDHGYTQVASSSLCGKCLKKTKLPTGVEVNSGYTEPVR